MDIYCFEYGEETSCELMNVYQNVSVTFPFYLELSLCCRSGKKRGQIEEEKEIETSQKRKKYEPKEWKWEKKGHIKNIKKEEMKRKKSKWNKEKEWKKMKRIVSKLNEIKRMKTFKRRNDI